MNKLINSLLVASVVLVAPACKKVERIEVEPKSVTLSEAGQELALSVRGLTADGEPVEKTQFEFSTSDVAVALVDAKGKVRAVKSGSAHIMIVSGETRAQAPVEVSIPAAISVKGAPFTLTGIGSQVVVEAEVRDDAGRPVKEAKLEYSAADTSVVEVTGNQLVARAAGTTSVKVTSGKLEQSFEITVKLPEVDAVAFETVPATLRVGESAALAVVAKGADGASVQGVAFTFTTSDEKIATVDASGKVTALKPGAVTVKAEGGAKATEAKLTIKK